MKRGLTRKPVLQKIKFPMLSLFNVVLLVLLCMLHLLMQPLHLLTHIFYLNTASLPPPASAHAEFVLIPVRSKNSIAVLHETIAGEVLRLATANLTIPPYGISQRNPCCIPRLGMSHGNFPPGNFSLNY
jgi:hypothetical protein